MASIICDDMIEIVRMSRKSKIDERRRMALLKAAKESPAASLADLSAWLLARHQIKLAKSTIFEILKKEGVRC